MGSLEELSSLDSFGATVWGRENGLQVTGPWVVSEGVKEEICGDGLGLRLEIVDG